MNEGRREIVQLVFAPVGIVFIVKLFVQVWITNMPSWQMAMPF